MEKTKATRNPNLDLVRILACVAVVGLHTVRLNGSFFYVALYNICGFAVPAFFMASGYMLLNRDALRPGYVVRKIAGVLRLAVCWTVLVCLLYMLKDVLEGMSPLPRIVELPGQIVLNLLQRGHIWQFWYLGATMLVYACLPALYRLKNRRGGSSASGPAWSLPAWRWRRLPALPAGRCRRAYRRRSGCGRGFSIFCSADCSAPANFPARCAA